jgi:formylglycine-generating enzyme required for sulfatase activity
MLNCIQGFRDTFAGNRFLVTCRPYAYDREKYRLTGFAAASLADFHPGQIICFINRWYAARYPTDQHTAKSRASTLRKAVLGRPDLHKLVKRPLLLTLTAYLHANRHELPRHRADLYERLLELLIEKWEAAHYHRITDSSGAKREKLPGLAEFLSLKVDTIRQVLERLAFQVHAEQEKLEGVADIRAADLTHQLSYQAKMEDSTRDTAVDSLLLCEYLRDRVGILHQRGGTSDRDAVYTFPHRSFQEYLAATYFRRMEDEMFDRFPEVEADRWWELAAGIGRRDPDRWREVVLLAGGHKVKNDPDPIWSLVESLLDNGEENEEQGTDQEAWGLRLAVEIIADNLDYTKPIRTGRRILRMLKPRMTTLLTSSRLPAKERAEAGSHIAAIGDPRSGVMDIDGMEFCYLPKGEFFLGSTDADPLARNNEKEGAGIHDLDYPCWLARFPVTVAQFRRFIEATGFIPKNKKCLKGEANTPVVYVSWDEAMQFCDWLNKEWQENLPAGYGVSLPSEVEWEKAARGGTLIPAEQETIIVPLDKMGAGLQKIEEIKLEENPLPQRIYPWGNEPDGERMNFDQSNIGRVSAVGCFPGGVSPYGCEEMSGNVWEWTRSDLHPYPYPEDGPGRAERESGKVVSRVVRGGAFWNGDDLTRCACRYVSTPDNRGINLGFRLCLSPSPSNP